jgi:hypothetical protein
VIRELATVPITSIVWRREALIESARAEGAGRHNNGTIDRYHGAQWQAARFGDRDHFVSRRRRVGERGPTRRCSDEKSQREQNVFVLVRV